MITELSKNGLAEELRNIKPSSLLEMRPENIKDVLERFPENIQSVVVEKLLEADNQAKLRQAEFLEKGTLEIELKHKYMSVLFPTFEEAILIINNREEGVTLYLAKIARESQKINLVYKKE